MVVTTAANGPPPTTIIYNSTLVQIFQNITDFAQK